MAWVESAGHVFIHRRPLSEDVARTVLAVGSRTTRARTHKRLLRGGLFRLIELLKEIDMNTGRTGWDRRIEKGASCSVVSSVGLAHEVR